MRSLCVVAVLLSFFKGASASGQSISTFDVGPEGGVFRSLIADTQHSGTLYAGARHTGVFKTTNNGANWRYAGLAGLSVTALGIDQKAATLYAVAAFESDGYFSNVTIVKSDDGESWTPANSGLPSNCYPGALV